jgi:hypothetical protein
MPLRYYLFFLIIRTVFIIISFNVASRFTYTYEYYNYDYFKNIIFECSALLV